MKAKISSGNGNCKKVKINPTLSLSFIQLPQCVRIKLAKKANITNIYDFLKFTKGELLQKIENFKKKHRTLIKVIRAKILESLRGMRTNKKEYAQCGDSKLCLLLLLDTQKLLISAPGIIYEHLKY